MIEVSYLQTITPRYNYAGVPVTLADPNMQQDNNDTAPARNAGKYLYLVEGGGLVASQQSCVISIIYNSPSPSLTATWVNQMPLHPPPTHNTQQSNNVAVVVFLLQLY